MQIGDCVGVESRSGLKSDAFAPRHGGELSRRQAERREFPPPISWLVHPENLPWRPWVMNRYATSDGRLVINEERVNRRAYFVEDRSINGRLVLDFVRVGVDDGEESCDECVDVGDGEESCDECVDVDDGEESCDECGGDYDEGEEEEEEENDRYCGGGVELRIGVFTVAECYKYSGVSVKPCGGFVAAAAAVFTPPVHI